MDNTDNSTYLIWYITFEGETIDFDWYEKPEDANTEFADLDMPEGTTATMWLIRVDRYSYDAADDDERFKYFEDIYDEVRLGRTDAKKMAVATF
jgi:hypothetical protein